MDFNFFLDKVSLCAMNAVHTLVPSTSEGFACSSNTSHSTRPSANTRRYVRSYLRLQHPPELSLASRIGSSSALCWACPRSANTHNDRKIAPATVRRMPLLLLLFFSSPRLFTTEKFGFSAS